MPKTLEEISDDLEIRETLHHYSTALDVPGRRWDLWFKCFAEDAVCEYPSIGSKSPAELKELFSQNDATRLTTQHLLLNIVVKLDGDLAESRTECFYAAVNRGESPGTNLLRLAGLWFDDSLARTADGWRITHRVANSRWAHAIELPA